MLTDSCWVSEQRCNPGLYPPFAGVLVLVLVPRGLCGSPNVRCGFASPAAHSHTCASPTFLTCLQDNAGIPATVRKVFVIGPDRKVKLVLVYPTAVGRNFAEILRVIDALQLAAKYPIATPVNWTPGSEVVIQPTVPDAEAEVKFPGFRRIAVPSGKGYLRMTTVS